MQKRIIYIAGPVTGKDNYQDDFKKAETALQAMGFDTLNPALILDGVLDKDCMPLCLHLIEKADEVVLLPGWRKSLGALIEAHYALRQGKPLRELVLTWDGYIWKDLAWKDYMIQIVGWRLAE